MYILYICFVYCVCAAWKGERSILLAQQVFMRARWAYLSDKSSSSIQQGASKHQKEKARWLSHDNSSRSPRIIFHTSILCTLVSVAQDSILLFLTLRVRAQLVSICIPHKSKPSFSRLVIFPIYSALWCDSELASRATHIWKLKCVIINLE